MALHKLEPDIFARVYETILDTYARNKASLRFPRLAVIGAQPGAGKSTVTGIIANGFDAGKEPVVVNFDDLRNFHPAAKEIFQHHPFELAVYTNDDTWAWTDKFLQHVRHARNNTIYETTLRVVNPAELIIQAFQAEGYAVDLHALAVNSKLSIQGIYERFENQLNFSPSPRWTGIDFHDAAYAAFPANVGQLEATAGLERVAVYRRDGTAVYLNTDTTAQKTGAEQAVIGERDRMWTPEEKQTLLAKWAKIISAIESREGPKPDWYIENASRLHKEAELYSLSRPANEDEKFEPSQVEEITHHHVFARKEDELVCFKAPAVSAVATGRNSRLVPQPS